MNITNRQMFFMIMTFTIPYVIFILPRKMMDAFRTGAWLYIIVFAIIFSLLAGMTAYLSNKYKEKTLFEYGQLIVGKFPTYCFSIVYMIEFFLYTAFFARLTAEIIHSQLMIKTPMWIMTAVFIVATGYAASKGATNIGRIAELMGIILLVAMIIMYSLMASQGDILNIEPFINIAEPQKYVSMIPDSLYLFSGFELMTIIPFTKRNGKKLIGTTMFAILVLSLFYIAATETCIMILGPEDTSNYNYALFTAIRRIDIKQLQFLKRIDVVFITMWLAAAFSGISISIFTTVEYARKIISKPNNNIVLIVMCVLIFIACMLPQNNSAAAQFAVYTSYFFAGITIIIIPLTLLIIAKVKKHEKKLPE